MIWVSEAINGQLYLCWWTGPDNIEITPLENPVSELTFSDYVTLYADATEAVSANPTQDTASARQYVRRAFEEAGLGSESQLDAATALLIRGRA